MAKYDWQTIKTEYVTAPSEAERPTLEELAEKYGCNPSHLREKAAEEGWRMEAERYLQTVEVKRKEVKSSALAGELAEWDANCYKAAQAGVNLIFVKMKAIFGEIERLKDEGGELQSHSLPSFKSMGEMAAALERFQKVGKASLGEEEKLNIKIDYSNLTDDQLMRLAAGEDPRHVIAN